MSSSPYRHTQQMTGVIAPPPDDSDFLESEDEHDASQSYHGPTELEQELAAVATPQPSSQVTGATATPSQVRPRPVGTIMQMTHNFSFAYFRSPTPRADVLNRNDGREAAGLPIDPNTPQRFTTRINPDGSTQSEPLPASTIAPHIPSNANVHWFCIDSELVYLSFFEDWGPLNVAMFYRFCLHLHHLINAAQEESTASADADEARDLHLILYTSNDAKQKANAALLAAMYAMVCGDVTPADAFHPISGMELMPFRDAGYGRADYYLTIQDILYGVHRAIQERLLDLMTFDLDEYETYEQVQNGDWNWLTPNIIAFASPNDKEYVAELRDRANGTGRPTTPGLRRPMNATFLRTVQYFKSHNVKLVVRLNNPLYDSRVFEREGIEHVDMYFDDGSNPCEEIVRDFIARADQVISSGGAIAVHCKAGLGRTGVLIGAYLAYRHGFSAGESIGFMRIMRPGCVVGPQQHFMYQEAAKWIRWREQDDAKMRMERALAKQRIELQGKRRFDDSISDTSTEEGATDREEVEATLGASSERRKKKRKKAEDAEEALTVPAAPRTPRRGSDERKDDTIRHAKPAPCVGQPRKSPSPSRKRAAQAQAPATIARMGGSGTLGGSRNRIVSADNVRSAAAVSSSSSLELHASSAAALVEATTPKASKTGFEMNVDVHLHVQETDVDDQSSQNRALTPTPASSRALTETHGSNGGLNRNLDDAPTDVQTMKASVEVDIQMVKPSSVAALTRRERSQDAADDGLFVQGWTSPEPPSAYIQRMIQSSPQRSSHAIVVDSPPASPSSPSGVLRASPHIRERFGLRDTGSNQNTPRSRKEAVAMSAGLTGHQHSSSSGSLSSNSEGSLTSRDAAGSSDDLSTTPTLQPGPLEKVTAAASEKRPTPAASIRIAASSPVKGSAPPQTARLASRTATARPYERSTSAGSQRTGAASRPPSAMATRKETPSASAMSSSQPTSSATSSTIRRHASSAANSAGRVAAARERLVQRQAVAAVPVASSSAELQQRSSVKRARAVDGAPTPIHRGDQNHNPRAPSRAAEAAPLPVPRQALGAAASSTVNSAARTAKVNGGGGNVPRFAMSTAASAAKAAAAAGTAPTTVSTKLANSSHAVTSRFATYHHRALPPSTTTSATLARLHGRNVHRRRSSLGETDIVM